MNYTDSATWKIHTRTPSHSIWLNKTILLTVIFITREYVFKHTSILQLPSVRKSSLLKISLKFKWSKKKRHKRGEYRDHRSSLEQKRKTRRKLFPPTLIIFRAVLEFPAWGSHFKMVWVYLECLMGLNVWVAGSYLLILDGCFKKIIICSIYDESSHLF